MWGVDVDFWAKLIWSLIVYLLVGQAITVSTLRIECRVYADGRWKW